METVQKKSFTLPIVVMFALFFMIAFVTNLTGPMGTILKDEFGASNFLSQFGALANFIAYAFMGYPGGLMLKRVGYKKTALTAVVLGFVGVGIQVLSGQAGSFMVYVLGAFVAGFSMCLLNIVVNPMLNTLGGGGNKGNQLIQFGGVFNSVGGTISPVLVGYLVGANARIADASVALYIAMAIVALAFVILAATNIPEPHIETPEERAARLAAKGTKKKEKYGPLSFRHFIFGAVAIFIYVGIENSIPNMGNNFMSAELSKAIAGTVVGTYWFMMLIGRLIGGLVGGRVSSRKMMTFVSLLGIAFVLCIIFLPSDVMVKMPAVQNDPKFAFVMAEVPINMLFLVLCGLCTSVMWGSIFNLATEGLGKYVPAASGIFMIMVCGGGIIPPIQGAIADAVGYLNSYWVVIVCLIYMLFFSLVGSRNVNKNIPVE